MIECSSKTKRHKLTGVICYKCDDADDGVEDSRDERRGERGGAGVRGGGAKW